MKAILLILLTLFLVGCKAHNSREQSEYVRATRSRVNWIMETMLIISDNNQKIKEGSILSGSYEILNLQCKFHIETMIQNMKG